MLRRLAPAKINLALHVTGQRADGFHQLDSLVCFANIGDVLTVAPASELSLTVTGAMAAGVPTGADNLVLRAAALLGTGKGAKISLEKNLPIAAGIGGGSADAAAVLHLLCELWKMQIPKYDDLLKLGADLPVCLFGETTRMRGIGEKLERTPMPIFATVLVNPRLQVATPNVFKALETKTNPPLLQPPDSSRLVDWLIYLRAQRNDLQPVALKLAPEINAVLDVLAGTEGCELARMSGSGASCFGLYESGDQAQKAAQEILVKHPSWWVKATHLGG
jgi:4-diphosphocytidyl-2-C-methyl-D-erythritol kinase